MKHDLFEFNLLGLTWSDRLVRISLLIGCIVACILDLFFWSPLP